jgi:hypothetical protein
VVLAIAGLLVAAYAVVVPVRVTVDAAALGRLALATPAPATATGSTNGTGTGTGAVASVSYDLTVAVAIHNRNWAMHVWRCGPLDAELRFRGRTLARARLAGAGRDRIHPHTKEVYRLNAVAEGAPVELWPDAAAELARERAAGVFDLELAVFLEVHYQAHPYRRAVRVTCPLSLSMSTATAPAAFERVECA